MGSRPHAVIWGALVVAEVLFVASVRRRAATSPEHRPVALAATYVLAADVIMRALQVVGLDDAPRPLTTWHRAALYLETLLFTGWPCVVAALGLWMFLPYGKRVGAQMVLGAWLGVNACLVHVYPIGHEPTSRVFQLVTIAAVAVVAVAASAAWSRRWGRAHLAALFLAGTELVVAVIGPYATNIYRDWSVATLVYAVAFGALGFWYLSPRRDRRP